MVRSAAAGLALCLGALCAADSHAQARPQQGEGARADGSTGLRNMLFQQQNGHRASTPPVARYVVENSGSFILDRSNGLPLLQFEGSNEIWVLTAQSARGGFTIYKNDVGEPVLRVSPLGGLTVFTAARPQGAPASVAGAGSTLQLSPIANRFLIEIQLNSAMHRALRAVGQGLDFAAPAFDPQDAPFIIEATNIVADAFEHLAKSEKSRAALRRVRVIRLLEGAAAAVKLDGNRLTITVAPEKGFAGRPSSATIARAVRASG